MDFFVFYSSIVDFIDFDRVTSYVFLLLQDIKYVKSIGCKLKM